VHCKNANQSCAISRLERVVEREQQKVILVDDDNDTHAKIASPATPSTVVEHVVKKRRRGGDAKGRDERLRNWKLSHIKLLFDY
jgi:hypothetical protein